MKKLSKKVSIALEHKRLARSISALAGLTGAVSAAAGVAASMAEPTGISGLFVDLGLASEPWVVAAAPIIAGIAVGLGTAAGMAGFYSWCQELKAESKQPDSD
jgi:hypothetical protein